MSLDEQLDEMRKRLRSIAERHIDEMISQAEVLMKMGYGEDELATLRSDDREPFSEQVVPKSMLPKKQD